MSEDNEWVRAIVSLWNQLPKENQSDFQISFEVIKGFMGLEWLQKHFDPDLKKPSIFKISFGVTEEEATRNYRVIDLAELLINLKDVEGFSECISRMRASENPEAELAELHIAKMLYINRWPFRFVKPQGKKGGANYDLEII